MYTTLHILDSEMIRATHETLREAEDYARDAVEELGGIVEIFRRVRSIRPAVPVKLCTASKP